MAVNELPEMPNGPVMELHGQRKRFHVPHGLKPLMEEITREILRYQPNDIYSFLSKFMESKLAKREEDRINNRHQRWNSLEGPDQLDMAELNEFLDDLNISKDEADKHATKIQALFRGHKARKSLTEKGKVVHKDHRKSWEWKKWSWEGPSTLEKEQLDEFLEELKVDLESANKHATKIQALYRGHAVRRRSKGGDGIKRVSGEETKQESPAKDVEAPDVESPNAEAPGIEASGGIKRVSGEQPKQESPEKDVEAPNAGAPAIEASGVEEPTAEAPGVEVPNVEARGIEAPNVEEPGIEAPNVEAPGVEAQNVEPSEAETPNTDLPKD